MKYRLHSFLILTIVTIFIISFFANENIQASVRHLNQSDSVITPENTAKKNSIEKVLFWVDSLKPWLKKNGYSTQLIFVANMNLPMYVKRFYAVHPEKDSILYSCLMAHGNGGGSTLDSAVFSNKPGSKCTSLGKYRMGKSLFGVYGKGYFLDGLDITNNNARKRWVVWHYYTPQTSEENAHFYYYSEGCPLLSKKDFDYCDTALFQKETKPVLMYIGK